MEAPHIVACRALIMLASLVALPLVAVFGLPVDQNVLDLIPSEYHGLLTRALPRPETATATIEIPGETLRYQAAPTVQSPAVEMISGGPTSSSPTLAVHYDSTATQPAQFEPAPAEMPRMVPVSMGTIAADPDSPEAIATRLRDLGAIRYTLEPWGSTGELFRFRADVALGDDPRLHRYFDAVDVDQLTAMQNVLAQVEDWRTGR
jgi:hypothetical protein